MYLRFEMPFRASDQEIAMLRDLADLLDKYKYDPKTAPTLSPDTLTVTSQPSTLVLRNGDSIVAPLPVTTSKDAEPDPDAPDYDWSKRTEYVTAFAQQKGMPAVHELLARFEVERVGDVPEERRAEFMQALHD